MAREKFVNIRHWELTNKTTKQKIDASDDSSAKWLEPN